MWKSVATSCLVVALTACGSGGGGDNDKSDYKNSKGEDFGRSLSAIFLGIPGGRGLSQQARRYRIFDLVGELEDYSAPDQPAQVPNPAQDIHSMSVSGRYMSAADLVSFNQNFPSGIGSVVHVQRDDADQRSR